MNDQSGRYFSIENKKEKEEAAYERYFIAKKE